VTRLKTPGGKPDCSTISAMRKAVSGATSLGLSTTVQPAAIAGTTFKTTWLRGKFHGGMQPTTPTGSRTTSELPIFSSNWQSESRLTKEAEAAAGKPA